MNNNHEEEIFFEYFIRKYYRYAAEAKNLYEEKLMNYKSLDDFQKNALKDADTIILKYIDLATDDLSNLSMDNIYRNYFFEKYYNKKQYYNFEKKL